MPAVTDHILLLLVRELETLAAEVNAFPDDELVWTVPPGISNSAGNLAMHVAGNLRHFIGHVLGGTEYVRDREAEFGTRSGTRTTLVEGLREAERDLKAVLPRLSNETLNAPYPIVVVGTVLSTERFLLHLCSHAALHVGQTGYLRRMLTGVNESVGVVGIPALLD